MKCAWILALLGACSFRPGAIRDRSPDAAGADAQPADAAMPDGPGATGDTAGDPTCGWGFMPTNFDPCMLAASPAPLHVTGGQMTLDPDNPGLPSTRVMQSNGSTIEVVHLSSLTVDSGAELVISAATDRAGVVLAVDGDATIGGAIQVSGTDDPMGCGGAAGAAGQNSGNSYDGAGGGGGGAAAADGGDGGDGNGGMKGAHGAHGAHVSGGDMLSPLRGGCPGGAGGIYGGSTDTPAAGGPGGGALEISARGMVMNSGRIAAPGLGGTGAPDHSEGGGGGGAGGGILLEGMTVTTSGVLCADGGSGGEGGGLTSPGDSGTSGACNGMSGATTGIVLNTLGGNGGNGSYAGTTTGGAGGAGLHFSNGSPNGGGGGGGGGVGWIRLHAISNPPTVSGVVTPAANLH